MLKSKLRISFCLLFIAILLGCTVDFTLSDAGTDSGSDADSDSDSDTDSDLEPCYGNGTRYGENCYLSVSATATFFDAETACTDWGGHLVSIDDSLENAYVRSIVSGAVWIGLHNSSTINTGIPYPNNDNCIDMPIAISGEGGRYTGDTSDPYDDFDADNYGCQSSASGNDIFIPMQLDEAGSWMFALNMNDVNFPEPVFALFNDTGNRSAPDSCVGATQSFCLSAVPYSQYLRLDPGNYILMIDGNAFDDEGTFSFNVYQFTYTDATPLTYENWTAGEPDRAAENEDCVQMTQAVQGTWSDKPCSNRYGYVCKRPL